MAENLFMSYFLCKFARIYFLSTENVRAFDV